MDSNKPLLPHPRQGAGQPPAPEPPAPPVPRRYREDEIPEALRGIDDDYDDYGTPSRPPKKTRRGRLIALSILLVLIAGAAAGYWFVLRGTSDTTQKTGQPDTSQQPRQEAPKTVFQEKTKHYIATAFTLEFDYPEDWTVTEAEDGSRLTVRSPSIAMKAATGKTVQGQVVFTIRSKQQPLPEFDGGNARALFESTKLMYAKPSSVQRAQTYISFLSYAGSSQAGLDGVFVTGDIGYQIDQAVPKVDFAAVDPILSMTFAACQGGDCGARGQALALDRSQWKDTAFSEPLLNILRSLVVL